MVTSPPAGSAPAREPVHVIGLLTALIGLALVLLLPRPAGLPVAGQIMLGLLLFSVILWMTEAVDYAISAVLITALMAFLLGLAPNAAKPEAVLGTTAALTLALSGFANTALALVGAACFISAAMTLTGLDKRIALFILSLVGARTKRVVVGAILVGIVLSFLVPSTTARVACLVPIVMGIILAFGVDKRSRFAGLLMIATAQAASIWNVGVKTAAAQNMVAIGFIEKAFGQTITWLDWLIAAAPWSIGMSIALYFVMTRMMPPETEEIAGGKDTIRQALRALGPMTGAEWRLLLIMLTLLGLWSTEKVLHPFDTSSTTIAAIALMFTPGIGVMGWKQAQSKIPWGTIVLFGTGISLGTALLQTQAAAWLAHLIVAHLGLAGASAFMILALLSLFLIVVHLGFASATALASAMVPIMISVLQQIAGDQSSVSGAAPLNLIGMTLLLQFVVSFGFILPVNAPQNMVAYGTDTFSAKDFVRTGLVLTVIGYGLVLLLGATYWSWMGYLSH
ncbi:DASS family sodium-coupled anion symporter [Hylemonella gracilis]|uniref:Di-and tricarboxylate transporter n=1 Tax=Hylemonella gracilis ATCC 19624 TaxID=887062 RepID=F3KT89_9BURK|nr:DASS family sodium-coupled anion symporter [Hylemonella gracilis]EGI76990.1 di- and tricarboxylate transporter [Hylemonella gracilis ATCC 19624]